MSLDWYIRGSVHVKLVAALDVKHEITSIQILHYEKQVFLDVKTQMSQGLWLRKGVRDYRWVFKWMWSLPWSGRCSKGAWGRDFPRLETGPSSPPWCTPHHHPSEPRPFLEPSAQKTARFFSAPLKTPGNGKKSWKTAAHPFYAPFVILFLWLCYH